MARLRFSNIVADQIGWENAEYVSVAPENADLKTLAKQYILHVDSGNRYRLLKIRRQGFKKGVNGRTCSCTCLYVQGKEKGKVQRKELALKDYSLKLEHVGDWIMLRRVHTRA